MSVVHQRVNISDEAYNHLISDATRYGYIPNKMSGNARGLHLFIANLATLSYTDTRPPIYSDEWSKLTPRPTRLIRMTETTAAALLTLAFNHNISNRFHPQGPLSYISAVLEAIGLRFLSPTTEPRQYIRTTRYRSQARRQPKEFSW